MTSIAYWDQRALTAIGQGPTYLSAPVVVFGTSRTELLPWGSLSGRPVLNFGLSGIRCARAAHHAVNHLVGLSPWGVIIEMGVNDAGFAPTDPEIVGYQANMAGIVQAAKSRTPRVAVMTPVPFESGHGFNAASYAPMLAQLSYCNGQAAAAFGAVVFDQGARYRKADMTAVNGLTTDGTHYSRLGGACINADYVTVTEQMRALWPD